MNTLSKVLAVFCVLLSAVVFARWEMTGELVEKTPSLNLNPTFAGDGGVSVATSADGKTVYYACGRRLYKSSDWGETWFILK